MHRWHLELEDNLLTYVANSFAWYVKKINLVYVEDIYEIRMETHLGELVHIWSYELKDISYRNNAIPDQTELKELLCFLR